MSMYDEIIDDEKVRKIDEFLGILGNVKSNPDAPDGFWIVCKKCGSTNAVIYDDMGCGSEMTGCWGSAGLKCTGCGNAAEICSN